MVIMQTSIKSFSQDGSTLIEVLVAIVILAIGLLGLAGLQVRLQVSEIEAYQRSQALILLNDMASRIATNRSMANAALYVAAAPVTAGVGAGTTTCTSGATRQQMDIYEWCNALQGAAETTGTSKVGAMLGGRGCIESLGNGVYRVSVAWQGMAPMALPSGVSTCGLNAYDSTVAGATCTSDRCRRLVSTLVSIATL